jgi:hypothetical protein
MEIGLTALHRSVAISAKPLLAMFSNKVQYGGTSGRILRYGGWRACVSLLRRINNFMPALSEIIALLCSLPVVWTVD